VAVATGEAAEAFLGTQGYVWDTQSDMLMAMIGATTAMFTMARWQDRQIEELTQSQKDKNE
jgi:putative membrane protein